MYTVSKMLGHKSVQTTIEHHANSTDKGRTQGDRLFSRQEYF
jgi:hypothetical protein